ncbi:MULTISPECIES: hypothetical protein [unclassified Streptomyces]|uniref:hypothetical protein n=1 Tax=unclassified Streptomyces TaxID=2593676 RepID=UPI0012FEC06F|nr:MULTISPECIES: hypothetical protein [unclassified Streptomyces]
MTESTSGFNVVLLDQLPDQLPRAPSTVQPVPAADAVGAEAMSNPADIAATENKTDTFLMFDLS